MSLRLIELQVAIPRTMDASKSTSDLLHKEANQQILLNEATQRNSQIETKRVSKKEKADQSMLHSNNTNNQSAQSKGEFKHPFKGRTVDYSG